MTKAPLIHVGLAVVIEQIDGVDMVGEYVSVVVTVTVTGCGGGITGGERKATVEDASKTITERSDESMIDSSQSE